MNHLLVIWGAGGHGKVVLDVARNTQSFGRIVFVDDNHEKAGLNFCDCPIMGGPGELHRFPGSAFVVAIGENRARARCFSRTLERGLLPAALVHSTAIVSPSARIGPGTVVMPGAIVNAGAAIGANCIINTGAIIEHDCQIAAHVHISPRVALGGGVTVGAYALVGIGAVVLPGAAIGDECVVGAGAVVLKKAPARCTVVGVPARTLSNT